MEIDFNSLSFKIEKPTQFCYLNDSLSSVGKMKVKQFLGGFQDTQTSNYQQQTTNPFRRTFHLFKHIENQKKNNEQGFSNLQKTFNGLNHSQIMPIQNNQTIYSLENFDSFKNFNSKSNTNQFKQIPLYRLPQIQNNQGSYIKIQNDLQNSNQFSLIMDDLNCEIKNSDLIPNSSSYRRIKTQHEQPKRNNKKENNHIFCLTAQQQNSQSIENVKQFYLDLRQEQQKIIFNQQKEISLKKQIKELIYNFVSDIEILNQNQIDPQFLDRIKNCLQTVKKTSQPLSHKKSINTNKQLKIDKTFQNHSMIFSGKKELTGIKNKQNIKIDKNSCIQLKNVQKHLPFRVLNQKSKKKWL